MEVQVKSFFTKEWTKEAVQAPKASFGFIKPASGLPEASNVPVTFTNLT